MTTASAPRPAGWRMIDIVVAAVLAVAFGVAFLAWNALYNWTTPLFAAVPAAQAVMYGVWLLPGVLVGLVVRRPGAALFGGFVAAAVSAFLGSQWGLDVLLSGLIQGAGAELGFALFLYRGWHLPAAVLGGVLAGAGAAIHDIVVYYPDAGPEFKIAFAAFVVLSGAVLGGVGAWVLARALARRGVLAAFESGRDQRRI